MRNWWIVLTMALVFPAVSAAEPQATSECRYLNTQIAFFESRLASAEEVDNQLWEDRLSGHLEGLKETRSTRCPGYSDSDKAAAAFNELLVLAGKGALTFFTMGAF